MPISVGSQAVLTRSAVGMIQRARAEARPRASGLKPITEAQVARRIYEGNRGVSGMSYSGAAAIARRAFAGEDAARQIRRRPVSGTRGVTLPSDPDLVGRTDATTGEPQRYHYVALVQYGAGTSHADSAQVDLYATAPMTAAEIAEWVSREYDWDDYPRPDRGARLGRLAASETPTVTLLWVGGR